MFETLPLFPEQASTNAARVDALYAYLVAVSALFSTLIFVLVFVFAVKYRRRSPNQLATRIPGNTRLEVLWSVVPLILVLLMFGWGADLFFDLTRQPKEGLDVHVIGKQWMWTLVHVQEGNKEINELHVPLGKPVRLIMTSEDVIHSFFIPAFRAKMDVLPGRYTRLWFEPTKTGEFHLFCAEYCGTKHSAMIGKVVVMTPFEYERWLGGGADETPAKAGERLFTQLGCVTCHGEEGTRRGPTLSGLFGRSVQLQDGRVVQADEGYLRESIRNPRAKIVAGFEPLMPVYDQQLTEEQLLQIITYIKTLEAK